MIESGKLIESLLAIGITDLLGIPDNSTAKLHQDLANQTSIRNLFVTREGEAFAMAAGLWIGGRSPGILIQNTGLLESGDSLRGTLVRMRIPVLMLVSCRGYANLPGQLRNKGAQPPDLEDLPNPNIDSVALITEPTLHAWGIPIWRLRETNDLECLASAHEWAQAHLHPAALLLETGIVGRGSR